MRSLFLFAQHTLVSTSLGPGLVLGNVDDPHQASTLSSHLIVHAT